MKTAFQLKIEGLELVAKSNMPESVKLACHKAIRDKVTSEDIQHEIDWVNAYIVSGNTKS